MKITILHEPQARTFLGEPEESTVNRVQVHLLYEDGSHCVFQMAFDEVHALGAMISRLRKSATYKNFKMERDV